MASDFMINFFAGITTAFVIWLTINKFFPWIYYQFRPAPNLGGSWKYYDILDGERNNAGTAQFKQKGELLNAIANRTKSRGGEDNTRCFKYTGKYCNGYVRFEFEELESGGLSTGNLILYLSSNQKQLNGYTVYFDRDEGKVVAHPILFERGN